MILPLRYFVISSKLYVVFSWFQKGWLKITPDLPCCRVPNDFGKVFVSPSFQGITPLASKVTMLILWENGFSRWLKNCSKTITHFGDQTIPFSEFRSPLLRPFLSISDVHFLLMIVHWICFFKPHLLNYVPTLAFPLSCKIDIFTYCVVILVNFH